MHTETGIYWVDDESITTFTSKLKLVVRNLAILSKQHQGHLSIFFYYHYIKNGTITHPSDKLKKNPAMFVDLHAWVHQATWESDTHIYFKII